MPSGMVATERILRDATAAVHAAGHSLLHARHYREDLGYGPGLSGMCAPASYALVMVLARRGIAGELSFGSHGRPDGPEHAWVEAAGFLCDPTAQQLGPRRHGSGTAEGDWLVVPAGSDPASSYFRHGTAPSAGGTPWEEWATTEDGWSPGREAGDADAVARLLAADAEAILASD